MGEFLSVLALKFSQLLYILCKSITNTVVVTLQFLYILCKDITNTVVATLQLYHRVLRNNV